MMRLALSHGILALCLATPPFAAADPDANVPDFTAVIRSMLDVGCSMLDVRVCNGSSITRVCDPVQVIRVAEPAQTRTTNCQHRTSNVERLRCPEFGPLVLCDVPYVNRLFKNTGYGPSINSHLLMVTARIIIDEEEEFRFTAPVPEH